MAGGYSDVGRRTKLLAMASQAQEKVDNTEKDIQTVLDKRIKAKKLEELLNANPEILSLLKELQGYGYSMPDPEMLHSGEASDTAMKATKIKSLDQLKELARKIGE